MEVILILFGTVTAFVIAAFVAERFTPEGRKRAALRSLRKVPIGDAKQGRLVKVSGVVERDSEMLEAPLSGRACLAWQVTVSDPDRAAWVERRAAASFRLEDETGRALIVPTRAEIHGTPDYVSSTEAAVAGRGRALTFLEEVAPDLVRQAETRAIGLGEAVVRPQQKVTIVGVGQWEPDPEPDARATYRRSGQRLRVVDPRADTLTVILDD